VSWLKATIAFIYDFLADDGWEVLVGLAIVLPLTYLAAEWSETLALPVLIGGVLLTMGIALSRQLPRSA